MKKALARTLSLAALCAGPALAAPQLPAGAPSPWAGFYGGFNLGGVTSTATTVRTNGASIYDWAAGELNMPYGFSSPYRTGSANVSQTGVIGGLQIGYNYQFAPQVILGFETDFQGASAQGSGSFLSLAGATDKDALTHLQSGVVNTSAGLDWMGTARARIGYLVQPSLLVFATGGFAYGGTWAAVNTSGYHWHPGNVVAHPANPVTPTSDYLNQVSVGWAAGGGVEWMFMQNWSAKVEGIYYDLGALAFSGQYSPLINPAAPASVAIINEATTRVNYQGVVARLGVNYHFSW